MGGLCPNPGTGGTKDEESRSRNIDAQLRKDKKLLEHEVKLLLLGLTLLETYFVTCSLATFRGW